MEMNITKEEFIAYEKVRQSGVTNMFNVELVSELSGLSREQCFEIMKNYGGLDKQYPEVRTAEYKHTIGIVNLEDFGVEE